MAPYKDPLEGIEYDEKGKIIPTEDGRELVRYDIPLQKKIDYRMRDVAAAPVYTPPVMPAEDEPAKMPPVVAKPIVQENIALTVEPPVVIAPVEEAPVAEEIPAAAEIPVVEEVPAVEVIEAVEEAASVVEAAPVVEAPKAEPVQETVWELPPVVKEVPTEPFRVVGEVLRTYIVVEHGEKMTLIDKHAAHERIHFDRLSAYKADAPGQMLLVPELIRLHREDYALVTENLEAFENLGYELDSFGDDALMLRAVPADVDYADGRAAIEELCENLRSGRAVTYEQLRQELLKTVACKAAIKAGKSSRPEELAVLAEAVLSGKVKYCPHGRPVSVTYSRTDLDKQFDRIV